MATVMKKKKRWQIVRRPSFTEGFLSISKLFLSRPNEDLLNECNNFIFCFKAPIVSYSGGWGGGGSKHLELVALLFSRATASRVIHSEDLTATVKPIPHAFFITNNTFETCYELLLFVLIIYIHVLHGKCCLFYIKNVPLEHLNNPSK